MEKVEYNDIVFLEKLNEIKATIKNSGFRIDYRKAYDTDLVMRKVIDQLYDPKCEDHRLVELYQKLDRKVNTHISNTLVYYYFALYNENLDLLEKILGTDIGFYDEHDHFCFELLNREFTKYFSEEQYLFLIQNCKRELVGFYNRVFAHSHISPNTEYRKLIMKELKEISQKLYSTEFVLSEAEKEKYKRRLEEISEDLKSHYKYKYTEEERERYCKMFAELMTKDPFVCKTGAEEAFREDYLHALVTPDTLDVFGVDGLMKLNDVEKKLVSDNEFSFISLGRLKSLFDKYPDYSSRLNLNSSLLNVLSDDELYHLSEDDIPIYEKASQEEIVERLHKVLALNGILRKYPGFIKRDVFDSLTDDEISHLSERAVHKIQNLVINCKFYDSNAKYKLEKSSVRIAKIDRILQKFKSLLH